MERVPLRPDEEGEEEPFVVSTDELREGMDKSHMPDEGGGRQRGDVEERAVQKLVAKLREKGKSERFIEEHMDEIRERALDELYGQDRR